jgi:hypothetical protein
MHVQHTLALLRRKIGLRGALIIAFVLAAALLVTKMFVLTVLVVAAFLLTLFIRTFHLRMFGIELVTFLTILAGYLYGPDTGMLVGMVSILFHLIGSGYFFGLYYMWVVPSYVIIGMLAGLWSAEPIDSLGVMLVLTLNGVNLLFTLLLSPSEIGRYIPFALTDILFNVMLFILLAPTLVAILA